jgi:hypothetical protein
MTPDHEAAITRVKDGHAWRIGGEVEVAWIANGTEFGVAITSGIPPVFEAYATIVLPCGDDEQGPDDDPRHEEAVMTVLTEHTSLQSWCLGYLDTGADYIVFPDAPMVELYAGWSYVLVEAGPEQAAAWREEAPSFKGVLPDLMFPADRSWLYSKLWDDDWTCVGGSATLIEGFMHHPDLEWRTRRVNLSDADATPPGHVAR